jgi:transcriptional regulator with XRE-family HTH domain
VNSRITFGAELRYAMHVRGLSLTEVARRSGVAVATATPERWDGRSTSLPRCVSLAPSLRSR